MCFWQLLSVHFQLLIWIFPPFTACWSATDSTLPILPPLAASVIFLFLCFIEYVPVAFCQNCSTDTWWTGENNYLLFLSVKYTYRQALVLCLLITDVPANYCWWYGESNDLFVWYSRAKPRQDEAMQGEKFPEDLSMGASVGVEVMEGGMGRSGQDGWKASHSRLSQAGIPPVHKHSLVHKSLSCGLCPRSGLRKRMCCEKELGDSWRAACVKVGVERNALERLGHGCVCCTLGKGCQFWGNVY